MKQLPKSSLLQIWSSGYDKFNIKDAKELGLITANNGGHNSIAVAEQTLMLILSLMKKSAEGYERVRSGNWKGNNHGMDQYLLHGRSIGIIGLGAIGSKVAQLATAFGMEVSYYDIVRKTEEEKVCKAKYKSLDEIIEESDIITLHLHLNSNTQGMINDEKIKRMKDGVIIINVSRAELMDRRAMIENLNNGKIGKLGLDVYYEEPNSAEDPLINHPNFFGTPHSSCTYDTHCMALDACISNINNYMEGNTINYII